MSHVEDPRFRVSTFVMSTPSRLLVSNPATYLSVFATALFRRTTCAMQGRICLYKRHQRSTRRTWAILLTSSTHWLACLLPVNGVHSGLKNPLCARGQSTIRYRSPVFPTTCKLLAVFTHGLTSATPFSPATFHKPFGVCLGGLPPTRFNKLSSLRPEHRPRLHSRTYLPQVYALSALRQARSTTPRLGDGLHHLLIKTPRTICFSTFNLPTMTVQCRLPSLILSNMARHTTWSLWRMRATTTSFHKCCSTVNIGRTIVSYALVRPLPRQALDQMPGMVNLIF